MRPLALVDFWQSNINEFPVLNNKYFFKTTVFFSNGVYTFYKSCGHISSDVQLTYE